MIDDQDDLPGALPQHPRPAPARREAAIGEAIRRFDGGGAETPAVPPRRALRTRPQLTGLVAASLVVVVALPAAWFALSRGEPHSVATSDGAASEPTARQSAPPQSAPPQSALPESASVQSAPVRSFDAARPVASRSFTAPAAIASPPAMNVLPKQVTVNSPMVAPVSAPPQLAQREERGAADAVASRSMDKAAPPPPPPPPPPAATAASPAPTRGMSLARRQDSGAGAAAKSVGRVAASDNNDVIVTAQRVRRSGAGYATTRGAWNACTVNDPRRNLAACRADKGEAGAMLGEGLAKAWQGDERAAIAAFDRAIALEPKSAQAWLNRGLARANAGDSAGALADLDRAVRLAPTSARAHYVRGRVLRNRGDTRRAQAEFERAAELDPAFGDLDN